jgi:uncharacterized protein YggE
MTRYQSLVFLPLLATLAVLPTAFPARAEDRSPVPSLAVEGNGQIRVAPDEATVRLGVVAQDVSARTAQEKANRISNAILTAIEALGVDRKDVQTSQLTLNPLYAQARPDPNGTETEPRIASYQASYSVMIRLEKLDLIGRVVDAGLTAGANQIEGVTFSLRDDRPARQRALEAAVQQGRAKAQTLAGALGVKLGEVLEVSEGNVAVTPPVFEKRLAFQAMDAASSTPVVPGEIAVDASVAIRYRIAP